MRASPRVGRWEAVFAAFGSASTRIPLFDEYASTASGFGNKLWSAWARLDSMACR